MAFNIIDNLFFWGTTIVWVAFFASLGYDYYKGRIKLPSLKFGDTINNNFSVNSQNTQINAEEAEIKMTGTGDGRANNETKI